jgi:DtxR family Mn-dependent transcriptional regulator
MDELLEGVWTLREKGRSGSAELLEMATIHEGERWLKELIAANLVQVENGNVQMTKSGEREAEQIIRRHRLAERLFADVFMTTEEVWEREACELEHQTVLTEEAITAVCAFLGHPPTCPHGRPIPRGRCCSDFKHEIKPFVIPLSEARLSDTYRIVFITPKSHMRLDRLAILGILPGSDIRIHQKKPSYVIRAGETDVALDPDIVSDIYVKKVS